ncbi:MAG TPA: hemerythrin domain-containing protein [Polyangia bacterium]|nr:hemerythrin domain-containing protein [Polyangia bacterium]
MTEQTQNRLDTLTPIHKGIRRSLFETAMALARTDFAAPEEIATAQHQVASCFGFLREHAEHEDRHVIPEVLRRDPVLGETLELAHPRLERMSIEIDSLWPRFVPLPDGARRALGLELIRRFQTFVAEQLLHMDQEERQVVPLLQAAFSDQELAAMSARITASIPPVRLQAWGGLLAGALNAPERAAMASRPASP